MKTKPIDLNTIEVVALLNNGNLQIRRKVKPKSGGEILGWGEAILLWKKFHVMTQIPVTLEQWSAHMVKSGTVFLSVKHLPNKLEM